ncbi:hypothetical protein [Clostridium algidicarnis]|uniref:Uncharacterized protein n=2 Tax=Clostridium algidicarnis TaxID=37659 RepID=A0A2S6G0F9_9CLOT|nr:hypothetical protein [Clostridium algidicarnis]MBB6696498.1 hypothetical protein [Clostridium algidicarnis]MBU3194055.1 hypothetical protein [Clostridium algidicarnis]MBU3220257.1 hypothetical protein [Clostridium algidicarnis]MCB2286747.1 hypothetical protein [Clostridium algidicarnis]PPK49412.1 hypothetical protein BD821_10172 [Clostridium algidicarnis DSM 15099]
MMEILKLMGGLGEIAVFITPLTLVIGIINAIKKPEKESTPYKIMAIISAYLNIDALRSLIFVALKVDEL